MSLEDQIRELEEEYSRTEKNKKTELHLGRLRARIAYLKDLAEKRRTRGGGGPGYAVRRSGHATVAIVGFPSVGKSTILNRITNAFSEVGEYDFTTINVIPGIMEYSGAKIQVLDLPGLIKGAARGKGRGREVLSVIRSSDLIMLVCDPFNPGTVEVVVKELYDAGIRLNQKRPDVVIRRKSTGGIEVYPTVKLTRISEEMIKEVMREYGYISAEAVIREDIDIEELIDVLSDNRRYIPAFVTITKIDLADKIILKKAMDFLKKWRTVLISGEKQTGIEELKMTIYNMLDFMRIYLKPQWGEADMEEPLVIKRGGTVEDVCRMLHKEFIENFRYALVWGKSARFPGQRIGLSHVLEDGDVLSIVIKRSAGETL